MFCITTLEDSMYSGGIFEPLYVPHKKVVTEVDDFEKEVICRTVQEFYEKGLYPTRGSAQHGFIEEARLVFQAKNSRDYHDQMNATVYRMRAVKDVSEATLRRTFTAKVGVERGLAAMKMCEESKTTVMSLATREHHIFLASHYTLRTPENLSLNRAAMAVRAHIKDFYDNMESLLNSLGISDIPSRLWNYDETELSFVLRIDNDVHIVTFPSHTTHLLQPLNVRVYRSLKEAWRKELSKLMVQNPGEKPDKYNFNAFLAVAYHEAFQATTVNNSFSKTGIFPLNRSKVSDEDITLSFVTEAMGDNTEQALAATGVDEVLTLPVSKATPKKSRGDPATKFKGGVRTLSKIVRGHRHTTTINVADNTDGELYTRRRSSFHFKVNQELVIELFGLLLLLVTAITLVGYYRPNGPQLANRNIPLYSSELPIHEQALDIYSRGRNLDYVRHRQEANRTDQQFQQEELDRIVNEALEGFDLDEQIEEQTNVNQSITGDTTIQDNQQIELTAKPGVVNTILGAFNNIARKTSIPGVIVDLIAGDPAQPSTTHNLQEQPPAKKQRVESAPDPEAPQEKFAADLKSWLLRQDPKINTFVLEGISNGGKSVTARAILECTPSWEEVMNGTPTLINVKWKEPKKVNRTNFLITTNHATWKWCSENEAAYRNRMHIYYFVETMTFTQKSKCTLTETTDIPTVIRDNSTTTPTDAGDSACRIWSPPRHKRPEPRRRGPKRQLWPEADSPAGPSKRPKSGREQSDVSGCAEIDRTSDSEQSETGTIGLLQLDLCTDTQTEQPDTLPPVGILEIPHKCDIIAFLKEHVGQNRV
ncbi:hypothetical protein ANN_24525 [Periplaneta americana]|uniref:DDE-1 domain-containing protein n=1 Tax=Periplaneta americana TaxID=6978 RepID=A0ABQ8S396_PERAM|nr:hypothetical protein ANN_24525 [Periplaneta americana]